MLFRSLEVTVRALPLLRLLVASGKEAALKEPTPLELVHLGRGRLLRGSGLKSPVHPA